MKKYLIATAALAAAISTAFAFKVNFFSERIGIPIHESITRGALDSIVVYLPSGKVARIKHVFRDYLAEENTENDENGIDDGLLHFDDSQMVDSARHTFLAVENAIAAFASGDYSAGYWTSWESPVQSNLGSAMHTLQDFFAHSTWVETNDYFAAFDSLGYPSDWARQSLPLPKIGMLEYPFNERGFLSVDGITLLDDKKSSTDGDNVAGGCEVDKYNASVNQLSSAYYDFKMSAVLGLPATDLGFSTTAWNGACVAVDATYAGRINCDRQISWPAGRCVHGDSGRGINKDDESRPLHKQAYNSAWRATAELMLHFIRKAGAATTANETKACALIFECNPGSPPRIGAPRKVANPATRPSWDNRNVYAFTIDQPMNYLLEVSVGGVVCPLVDENLTITSNPEKFFACPSSLASAGQLRIYQKANPDYTLFQVENFLPNPQPAPATTLSLTPDSIAAGTSATLQWSTTNATGCVASGAWTGLKATSGAATLQPSAGSYAYTLTCTGPGGSSNATATLIVTPPTTLPTVVVRAVPSSIASGATSEIQWSTSDATDCTASGAWSGARLTSGAQPVSPAPGVYTFDLTCRGPGGSAQSSAELIVSGATSVPSVNLSISPASVTAGTSALLQWSSANVVACTAGGDWSGAQATNGTLSVSPAAGRHVYTLTCTGAAGSASASATLTVGAALSPPTVSLTASPASISEGASSTLQWNATNAANCTSGGDWSLYNATSGSMVIAPPAGSYSYTLSCSGPGGVGSATATLSVIATSAPGRLSPSGATASQCYSADSTSFVNCSSTGAIGLSGLSKQDGMRGGSFVFTEVPRPGGGVFARTECVVDSSTGLMWEGKTADGGTRDGNRLVTNYGDGRASDSSSYVDAVNGLALCGFRDWRLPTAHELSALIDFGKPEPGPTIVSAWFPNTRGDSYWTGTRDATSSGNAWFVDFGGTLNARGSDLRSSRLAVRLVRGSVAETGGRFTYVASGAEVIDSVNGLIWRRCTEGMTWNGSTCTGSAVSLTHAQAFARARDAGEWRLPTARELATLVDFSRASGTAIDPIAFPATPFRFTWSSTGYTTRSSDAWGVGFAAGEIGHGLRNAGGGVRLVRKN